MTKRLWIILVLTLLIGFLLSFCHVVPVGSSSAAQRYCITESGIPCSYRPHGVRNTYKAGVAGPMQVKVPDRVRTMIRQAVAEKGPKFQRRAHELSFFDRAVWTVDCVQVIGYRQIQGYNYPKCFTKKQLHERVKRIKKMTFGCGQSALITTFIGGFAGGKRGTLVGALGGAVGCMADKGFSVATSDLDRYHWLQGPKGPVPGSGGGGSW